MGFPLAFAEQRVLMDRKDKLFNVQNAHTPIEKGTCQMWTPLLSVYFICKRSQHERWNAVAICSRSVMSIFLSKRNVNIQCGSLTGDYLMLSWTPEDAQDWCSHLAWSVSSANLWRWSWLAACTHSVLFLVCPNYPGRTEFLSIFLFPLHPTLCLPGKLSL